MNLTLNRYAVQRARERRGWTQRHLADFADLSLRTVERAESRGTASLDTAKRLARALDITLDELLTTEEEGLCCKIFKLIKIDRVIAAKTNSLRENGYIFYLFYPCSMVEYLPF